MSANLYNFKKIPPVPTSKDFLDIVLSKTQRKTPTVVHKGYSIGRIRQFYMRKVKFTHDSMEEKLKIMLDGFPKLENIHPFYADLMNILYDKDHYKLALGQLNTARHLIGTVAKDYVRMMKFGDSLYRCKQLKRAALGRMATIMRRQKESLAYLEQVRQHLARLPSIDPNTRTLLLCGYPNVGKSSFMNKVTRAEVEVQPYAFTTKSLFVGHMDYRYLRWQVLDTPGILDHPLEERNTIEMQSITALAHLRACVLYFLDISEQCGYSIEAQLSLFHSIKPLFANKQLILVISKIDVLRPDQLDPENAERLNQVIQTEGLEIAQLSTYTDEGVMETKQRACEKLLQARVEVKLKGSRINDVLNRLQVAQPMPRDELDRPAFIPEAVKTKQKYDPNDPLRPRLEKDLEVEAGGAGVYNVDLKKKYLLKVPEWKQDAMPEILDGKNVADFIDPDILEKLDALEREEERLTAEGYYESESEGTEEEEIRELAGKIKNERKLRTLAHHNKQGKNRPVVPAKVMAKRRVAKQKEDDEDGDEDMMEVDAGPSSKEPGPLLKRLGSARKNRSLAGLKSEKLRELTSKLKKNSQRPSNLLAKRGESDRVILVKKPRHLFAGKRKMGKTDRR